MAKPLIVGNWKAYVASLKEAKKLFKDIEKALPRELKSEVVLCPPHSFLPVLTQKYSGKRITFGAQDIFFEEGAHTGEVTGAMVKDVGARFAIVGHAEKRAQGDTDAVVAKKVGAALDARLTPIVAFGESSRDKDGHYLKDLGESIVNSLGLIPGASLKKVVLAYEPVWAIGAPLPPTARTIRETIIFIRKTLVHKYGRSDSLKVRILYGGAVNEESAPNLRAESEADGLLLGRASIHDEAFVNIVRAWT